MARLGRAAVAAALAASTMVAAGVTGAGAASSSTVVTLDVPSATSIDATSCAPATPGTDVGIVQPGTGAVTGADCSVTFGSSNDTAHLRAYQRDGGGRAMAPWPSGTVAAWWPLNGTGDDLAASPNPLTMSGGGWATGPTGHGQARTQTGGSEGASAPDTAAYDLTSFTIDAWFRTTHTAGGFHWLVTKRASSTNINYGIWYDSTAGSVNVQATTAGSSNYTDGSPASAYVDGAWHHVAMVSSGSALSLYLDGEHVNTRAYTGTIDTNTAPVEVGTHGGVAAWPGDIDEVRIQSGARSAAEIRSYFQQPLPDHLGGSTDWSVGTSGMFGACLRAVSGSGVVGQWTVDATCPASNGTFWNAVPETSGATGSIVARSTTSGLTSARVDMRFGMRVAAAHKPGRYAAPITFEVVAPN